MKFKKNIPFHEARQRVKGPVTDPSKNYFANVAKLHKWTNNIKPPNNSQTEEEGLYHTIDSLFTGLDAIKSQNSKNHALSTSSASQLSEFTLPVSASTQTNESAMLSNVRHDPSAVTRKMTWSIIQQAIKVVSTRIAQKRNPPVLFQLKELPLVPHPVGRMALSCQKWQEGEIYQRSPLSVQILQNQEDRGWLWGNGLPYGLPMV